MDFSQPTQTVQKTRFVIGIDLGTTNSCCAIIREGSEDAIVVPDEKGDRLVPSVVAFLHNKIITGSSAAGRQSIMLGSVVYDNKRLMDIPYDDAIRLHLKSKWPFTLHKESIVVDQLNCDVTTIGVEICATQHHFLPEEIAAHILFTLKSMAEKFIGPGASITKAVVCVPANHTIPQKEATKTAAIIAGFNSSDLVIMNEPTAAALAYDCQNHEERRNLVVYDLGGGTFDVTVLTVQKGVFDVLSTGGSPELGGRDFDLNMREEFLEAIKLKEPGIQLTAKQLLKLLSLCEVAKKELLQFDSIDVTMEEILADKTNFTYTFTREGFNELNEALFQRTMQIVKNTVRESKLDLTKTKIHDIVLVGGSTRIPKIVEMMTDHFGILPVTRINPDEAVAIGAAKNAAIIGGSTHENFKDKAFLDVAPNHFGISTWDKKFSIIIFKNTPLPYTSPAIVYETSYDDQEALSINVYEGMDTQVAKQNRLIGYFIVDELPMGVAGNTKITVEFEMSNTGFLKVTVEILANGRKEVREMEARKKIPPSLMDFLKAKFDENRRGIWGRRLTTKRPLDPSNENEEMDDEEQSHEEVVVID